IPIRIDAGDLIDGDTSVPVVSASASRLPNGALNVTLVNADPHKPISVALAIPGLQKTTGQAVVLSGPAMNAMNTFENPTAVQTRGMKDFEIKAGGASITLPALSVVAFRIDPPNPLKGIAD